jgi:hypothetical protein
MATNAELAAEVKNREVWFHFFAAHREIYSIANRTILDEWLDQNGKVLDVPSLNEAYAALKGTGKLHILSSEAQARRVEEETPVELSTTSAQGAGDQLPLNMPTRSQLRRMSGPEFSAAIRKVGEANVMKIYNSKRGE